jgi:hypothetical protein
MFEWRDKQVRVRARLVPRYLWLTASIDVYLENECILRSGGQLKIMGTCSASFDLDGLTHIAFLTWGLGRIRFIPFKLQIDGVPVADSSVYVQNWPVGFFVWLFGGCLLSFLLTGFVW